jgi:predicted DNA binding CopG/RHH family protein
MKTLTIILLTIFTVSLFTGCTNTENLPDTNPRSTTKKNKKKGRVLFTHSVSHAFSKHNKMDVFKISLTGDSILTGNIRFEIISYKNKKIYNVTFPSIQLLNYDIAPTASDREKEQFIKQRMKEFFSEENFKKPAIDPDHKFDNEYSDEESWVAIKEDPTAIGFYYLVGEEDGRSIAWSKKLGKVVLYYTCC